MPLYEYQCGACEARFERRQGFHDEPVRVCPECGGATRRVLFPAGIIFKGSGWYVTDSRPATSSTATNGKSSDKPADAGAKTDVAKEKTDTKAAASGEKSGATADSASSSKSSNSGSTGATTGGSSTGPH